MQVKPYYVQVTEETLQDLRERLTRLRWPDEVENAGWEYTPWPKPGDCVRVPLGVALTATQQFERPPREYVERLYPNILHWTQLPRGGHFVALEEPQLVAESIRAFFRLLRQ